LQLAGRLSEPGLLQLRQRISIFASLQPLSLFETADYIQHRLKIAGYTSDRPLFTPQALTSIARHSGGVPRNINNLCFNSLSLACALKKTAVDAEVVSEVICDLDLRRETTEDNIVMSGFKKPLRKQSLLARWQPSRPALRVAGIAMVISAIASAVGWTYLANMGLVRAGIPSTPASVHSATTQAATLRGKFDSAAAPVPAVSHAAERPLLRVVPVASLVAPAKPAPHSQDPAGATDTFEASTMVEDELRLVEARSGQTVAGICVEQYGGCTPHLLHRIIELNPRIADPDHIEQGQRIVLPAAEAAPDRTERPPDSDWAAPRQTREADHEPTF
jgi:phage tail protein X